MSQEQIQLIASMLTDDPDILVNEWLGQKPKLTPLQQKLAAVTSIKDQAKLKGLEDELKQFAKYRPSLQAQGEDAIIKAFITYKKTGKMPLAAGLPSQMDQFGGKDFRVESRQRR